VVSEQTIPTATGEDERWVKHEDLAPNYGITWGRSTIFRRVKDGTFPRPRKPSGPHGPNVWTHQQIIEFQRNPPAPKPMTPRATTL
jgi:predicted DNA-binding transcriptional regulator AlpA